MSVDREINKEVARIYAGMSQWWCSLVSKSCPMTLGSAMDYSLPGSSVHGISEARILEWLPFSSSGDLPDPRIISCIGRGILYC